MGGTNFEEQVPRKNDKMQGALGGPIGNINSSGEAWQELFSFFQLNVSGFNLRSSKVNALVEFGLCSVVKFLSFKNGKQNFDGIKSESNLSRSINSGPMLSRSATTVSSKSEFDFPASFGQHEQSPLSVKMSPWGV